MRRTFAALGVRNFRIYFTGQSVSVMGTWMQRVAQSWLVLELTGSGTAVGLVTALQFLPITLMAPTGGVVADRVDKRVLMYVTQSLAALTAASLGVLVLTGLIELWMVYALAFVHGLVGSFDNPARRAFVVEMVGRDGLTNAVGLQSVLVNAARILGPAVAGVLIVTVGIGVCFVVNAVSYLAFILALVVMREADLERLPRVPRESGQLREVVAYVRSSPTIATTLVMLAVISAFAYEYEVVLPLLARFTYGGDADTFGIMFAAVGLGAIVGGLRAANRGSATHGQVVRAAVAYGGALAAAAVAPTLWAALLALGVAGATGTSLLTMTNAMVQLSTRPDLHGRVMALRAVAFLGVRPIGGPVVGWIGEHLGPRVALGTGAAAVLLVAVWTHRRFASITAEAT